MKGFVVILSVVLLASMVMSATLGVLTGKEFGGRNRMYVGAQVTLGEALGIGLDAYYPVSSLESAAEEISNVKLLELDPGIFLALKISDMKIYAFAGPMIILNVDTMDYNMVPIDTLRGKVGMRFKMGGFSLFVEGITAFQYSGFATSGIYGVQGGISLGF